MLKHAKLFHFNPLQIKEDLPCANLKNMLEMQPNPLSLAKAMMRRMKTHFQHGFSLYIYEVRFKCAVQTPQPNAGSPKKVELNTLSLEGSKFSKLSCKAITQCSWGCREQTPGFFLKGPASLTLNLSTTLYQNQLARRSSSRQKTLKRYLSQAEPEG